MHKRLFISMALVAAISSASFGQIVATNDQDVRVVTEPSGVRDNDNGGDANTGRLIGLNTAGIDNFMVFGFDDLNEVAGETVFGATITFFVAVEFSNANHGSIDDVIVLNELALPNDGWIQGNGVIGGSTNSTNDGSISYNNRVQFLSAASSEPWMDATGAPVANLEGAITPIASLPGFDEGTGPLTISFDVDAATAQNWADNGLAGLVLSAMDLSLIHI